MRVIPLAAAAPFAILAVPAESQLATPTGVWTTKASLPTAHSEVASAVVGGKIYIVGGTIDVGTMAMSLNEEYDPATDRARERAPLRKRLRTSALSLSTAKYLLSVAFPTCKRIIPERSALCWCTILRQTRGARSLR